MSRGGGGGGGGDIDIKMLGTCHSTDQNETQKSTFMTEKVDPKSRKFLAGE